MSRGGATIRLTFRTIDLMLRAVRLILRGIKSMLLLIKHIGSGHHFLKRGLLFVGGRVKSMLRAIKLTLRIIDLMLRSDVEAPRTIKVIPLLPQGMPYPPCP